MQGWKSNWLYMNINQQHAWEKKTKQFYGFKKREELFLEDNLRWYLGIVSDNIAEKLVWGNSSKTNQGETKPFFFQKGNRIWSHLQQKTSEIRQAGREVIPCVTCCISIWNGISEANSRSSVMINPVYFSPNEHPDLAVLPLLLGCDKVRNQQCQACVLNRISDKFRKLCFVTQHRFYMNWLTDIY